MLKNIEENEFEAMLKANVIVLVDFWAQWCAPCKTFGKVYEEVAQAYPNLFFAKVNVEEQTALAQEFNIRTIPYLMIFKQEILIYSQAGSLPSSVLTDLVEQALKVDVTEIRENL